ncbi:molybdopterin molybdenumtransferase [mine drainage metagenome]|uniref:molybdopterin molybdotransferase n=1 Tax=mine drainage metagenome TaxID=410659 RepID=A0A1J5RU27_9ZZZZ
MNSLLQTLSCADGYDPDALPVSTAQALILAQLAAVPDFERSFVRLGLDRVLAEDVIAPVNVPAHNNSAMDGYALRHAELSAAGETRLAIVGSAFAGRPFEGRLPPGSALRIMTGAIVPEGLDTVVPQEVTRIEGQSVFIPQGQRAGQHFRCAGEDLKAGQPALKAGKRLRPAEIGLLASLGQVEVTLRRRVRVAVFSTGDELCSLGTPLAPGQVYDSNRYTLWSMLTRLGCEVRDLGVVRDDPAALEAALTTAARSSDVVITSGGVSVGEADFVRELMARLGEVAFWKIAMKPGRPMAFGRIGEAWLFGLPGNPVAVMVTFYQFVRPALLKMMGAEPAPLPIFRVPSLAALKKAPGRTEFLRGILSIEGGEWCVQPTGAQGSGILSSMSDANCLIVLEHERGNVAVGDPVSVQAMDGLV